MLINANSTIHPIETTYIEWRKIKALNVLKSKVPVKETTKELDSTKSGIFVQKNRNLKPQKICKEPRMMHQVLRYSRLGDLENSHNTVNNVRC